MQLRKFQIRPDTDVNSVLAQTRHILTQHVRSSILVSEITIIVSEIVYNIIKYGSHGYVCIELSNKYLSIQAHDSGSGFNLSIDEAFKEGNSSAGSLGLGLASLCRLSDKFSLTTTNKGTSVTCQKELQSYGI